MKKMYIIVAIILIVFILSFIPLWTKPVKSGSTKVNTWTKIMLVMGLIKID